jgi:hypothetical protein
MRVDRKKGGGGGIAQRPALFGFFSSFCAGILIKVDGFVWRFEEEEEERDPGTRGGWGD